jgi:hypothetical protein
MPLLEAFGIRHSELDPESRFSFWIPAFSGMTREFRGQNTNLQNNQYCVPEYSNPAFLFLSFLLRMVGRGGA